MVLKTDSFTIWISETSPLQHSETKLTAPSGVHDMKTLIVVCFLCLLSCSYRIFICYPPFYLSVTKIWRGNVLFCSYTVWLHGFKSCYSYNNFYFIGNQNNFEKHPDYVPSVFPNKQQAKRVITPSRSVHTIRRSSIDIQLNGKYKGKAKRTLVSNKESRTQELDMLCIVPTTS